MNLNRVEILAEVLDSVAETLNVPTADITEMTLIRRDLEADSMDIVTLMVLLDDKFDAEFSPEDIPPEDVAIGWIVDHIIRKFENSAN
ncbi:MAG: acyl carrier protein [Gammaproteobacteria bacterium]|jgi:acyl carrier protein